MNITTLCVSLTRHLRSAAFLALVAVLPCAAAAVSYPEDAPAVTMVVPDGWKSEVDKQGLNIYPADKDLLFLLSKEDGSDIKEICEKFMEGLKASGKIKDISMKPGSASDFNGMKGYSIDMSGKDKDGDAVEISYMVFTPSATSGAYSFFVYGSPKVAEKYGKDIAGFIPSIKPK